MREIYIDLSSDNHLQQLKVFGGYAGEHNETILKVKLSKRMTDIKCSGYRFDFQTSEDNKISSPLIPISKLEDNTLSFSLTEQLTVAGNLLFNICAILVDKDENLLVSKTNSVILLIKDTTNGKLQPIDPSSCKDELQEMVDDRIARTFAAWRKINEIELTEATNKISITTDSEGKPFKLNRVMLAMELHFEGATSPFFIQMNGCDFMQVKTCANFNTDINRFMNFYAERTGEGAFGYAGITSVASSLAHTGYGSENETRHASTVAGFYGGFDSISLECIKGNAGAIPSASTHSDVANPKYLTATDIDGGVNIKYAGGHSGYSPYRYNVNLGGISEQGLKLKFNNYHIDATDKTLEGYGKITIILSAYGSGDNYTKLKKYVPALLLDTNEGTLSLISCNDISFGSVAGYTIHQEIIKSDLLKYENIGGKRFDVTIRDNSGSNSLVNRPYNVSVDIQGDETQTVLGVLDSAKLFGLQYHPKVDSCYTSIGGIDHSNGTNNWSIDFLGFENQQYGIFAAGRLDANYADKKRDGCKITVWGQDIDISAQMDNSLVDVSTGVQYKFYVENGKVVLEKGV